MIVFSCPLVSIFLMWFPMQDEKLLICSNDALHKVFVLSQKTYSASPLRLSYVLSIIFGQRTYIMNRKFSLHIFKNVLVIIVLLIYSTFMCIGTSTNKNHTVVS